MFAPQLSLPFFPSGLSVPFGEMGISPFTPWSCTLVPQEAPAPGWPRAGCGPGARAGTPGTAWHPAQGVYPWLRARPGMQGLAKVREMAKEVPANGSAPVPQCRGAEAYWQITLISNFFWCLFFSCGGCWWQMAPLYGLVTLLWPGSFSLPTFPVPMWARPAHPSGFLPGRGRQISQGASSAQFNFALGKSCHLGPPLLGPLQERRFYGPNVSFGRGHGARFYSAAETFRITCSVDKVN